MQNRGRVEERIQRDEAVPGSAIRESTKDKQVLFLRNEIAKLECKQLAESIVSIVKIVGSAEYELKFDPMIDVPPMRLDLASVKMLARYQRDIFDTSPYDASIAAAMQFNYHSNGRKRNHRKVFPASEAKPITQIRDLLDEEVLGREIDFTMYGLCHHCKEIKPRFALVRCRAAEVRANPALHKSPVAVSGCGGRKKNGPLLPGKHKKGPRGQKHVCERLFCYSCIHFNYDQNPTAVQADPAWICPYCQVQSENDVGIGNVLLHKMPATGASEQAADAVHLAGRAQCRRCRSGQASGRVQRCQRKGQ